MRYHRYALILLFGVFFLFACNLTDPSHLDRPPILKSYQPGADEITTFLGDTLSFSISAADPDGAELKHLFWMGDSVVCDSNPWVYVVNDTGSVTVRGVASDGGVDLEIVWHLERLMPENLPPAIRSHEPPDLNPVIIVDHQIDFRVLAEDPENLPITYFYKIADSVVSMGRHYSFLATHIGETKITAYATDGEKFNWVQWVVRVTDYPDTIAPAQVEILSLETGTEPGDLIIQWIAVGEDGMEGIPSYYQVRTSKTPIINEYTWQRASDRPGEPSPAPPGQIQQMMIRDLNPSDSVYVAVRAVDEFSNISPLSDSPRAKVKGQEVYGFVRNSATGMPIEGVTFVIGLEQAITDSDGWFAFTALPYFIGTVTVKDEANPLDYGGFFDLHFVYTVQHNDTLHLWMIPNLDMESEVYDNFLQFFKHMSDTYDHFFSNILRTWEIPFDCYIQPYEKNGLDFAGTIAGVLDEYEVLTGLDLFTIVDSPPDVGLRINYQDDLYADNYHVEEYSNDLKLPIKGLITFRTTYTPATKPLFEKIIRHEVGHALGLKHSSDRDHLMYGGVDFNANILHMTPDEMAVLMSMYHIPRLFEIDLYQFD